MREPLPTNPFDASADPDRHAIWDVLILVDSLAFLDSDWGRLWPHFAQDDFEGIRCSDSADPDRWELSFASLDGYRELWLDAARQFRDLQFRDVTPAAALFSRCRIDRIDLLGDRALAHKKFSGAVTLADGSAYAPAPRQTLYRLRKVGGRWKVTGFLGRLPLTAK